MQIFSVRHGEDVLFRDSPTISHSNNKVTETAFAPFSSIAIAFANLLHRVGMIRKVVAYHSSLAFNVAMNALFPKKWSWWSDINSQLILGAEPLNNKGHLNFIKDLGVTLVLSKLENFEYNRGLFTQPIQPETWTENNINIWRSPTADGTPIDQEQLQRDIARMREEIIGGGKIYVHCKAGRGRSTLTVLAYLCVYENKSFDEAYAYVKKCRPQIFLTPSQTKFIREFSQNVRN